MYEIRTQNHYRMYLDIPYLNLLWVSISIVIVHVWKAGEQPPKLRSCVKLNMFNLETNIFLSSNSKTKITQIFSLTGNNTKV